MPVHDWTRVSAGTFHDFRHSWIVELKRALNRGLLPASYYAQSEMIAGETLTHGGRWVRAVASSDLTGVERLPLVLIYRTSGDEIVALVEILSPEIKGHARTLERFLSKTYAILVSGYQLLLIDLHPPGAHDPRGIHAAVWTHFDSTPFQPPPDKPPTMASYCAGVEKRAYVEPMAVGDALRDMPLFLDDQWYVNLPLEQTYLAAYESVPERWQRVIEGREPA